MSGKHDKYSNLMVFYGINGELPHPGAFYAPRPGDTMVGIAKNAYGGNIKPLIGASVINRSAYNFGLAMAGKYKYRVDASSCKSKTLDKAYPAEFGTYVYQAVYRTKSGGERPLGNDRAWLGLCPSVANTFGAAYPPIWIPPFENRAEPPDVNSGEADTSGAKMSAGRLVTSNLLVDTSSLLNTTIPKTNPGILNIGVDKAKEAVEGGGGGSKAQHAGMPVWLGAVLGLGMVGGLYYWYRTAKS